MLLIIVASMGEMHQRKQQGTLQVPSMGRQADRQASKVIRRLVNKSEGALLVSV